MLSRGVPEKWSSSLKEKKIEDSSKRWGRVVVEDGKLTLDRLFDNKLINDVMSRIFVRTTNITCP